MHVLVTGGAGFIGSHLCRSFLDNGNKVTCLDDLSVGYWENVADLEGHPDFRFLEGDIRDMNRVDEAMKGQEMVYHQAALGSVPRSIADPLKTHDVNVNGFLEVLKGACRAGVKRFIYATSSSVYGDIPDVPKVEERIGTQLSPYAVSKYVDELYAKVFSDLYGIETIGLRYFNVFGPAQDPEGPYAAAIPKFFKALLKRERPLIHGDGKQMRDFTYVDNVIQANEMAGSIEAPDVLNSVYNVAYGKGTQVIELLELIQGLLGERSPDMERIEPEHGEERVGDLRYSTASIEKIRQKLGYEPQVDLEEGLRKALPHYIELFQNPEKR